MSNRRLAAIAAGVLLCGVPSRESTGTAQHQFSVHERLAVERLHQIYFAQERFRSLAVVDSDFDGKGEYASLGELTSVVPLRTSSLTLAQKIGAFPISKSLGQIDGNGGALSDRYLFQMFLPDDAGSPISETAYGGMPVTNPPDHDLAESYWVIYAWPLSQSPSTSFTFMINQQGVVLMTGESSGYSGWVQYPPALSAYSTGDDMTDPLPLDQSYSTWTTSDGNLWKPVEQL